MDSLGLTSLGFPPSEDATIILVYLYIVFLLRPLGRKHEAGFDHLGRHVPATTSIQTESKEETIEQNSQGSELAFGDGDDAHK